jgi:hypothetical protein
MGDRKHNNQADHDKMGEVIRDKGTNRGHIEKIDNKY